ncbi:hypothetical protein R1sor_023721 [Riccia sorocarpa]|uniref:Uncharacterized protein n=1 Tax=Riccia sorocarpa TaxID=122646 RepID=A0ABD3GRN9_9MARC
MMDSYRRKQKKTKVPEPDENLATPLEGAPKQKFPNLNDQFDGEALVYLLGQNKENAVPKKRRKMTTVRSKIGTQQPKRGQGRNKGLVTVEALGNMDPNRE